MDKRFLAIGNWVDKSNGKPVTRLAEINAGLNTRGQPYELADTESRETVEGAYPVGTILEAQMTFSVSEHQEDPKSLKLGAPASK